MDLLMGVLALVLGLVLCFSGYQFSRILIPIWGLFAGFTVGAGAVANITNEGFVGTTLGIVVGVLLGLIFALFAYFFFSLAVILLGASVGYWLGVHFMGLFGLEDGFLAAMLGIALGALFGLLSIVSNLPKLFLIVVTALGGAVVVVGGIMLMFNIIDTSAFTLKVVRLEINNSWLWSLSALVLAIAGGAAQWRVSRELEIAQWNYFTKNTATIEQ